MPVHVDPTQKRFKFEKIGSNTDIRIYIHVVLCCWSEFEISAIVPVYRYLVPTGRLHKTFSLSIYES